MGDKDNTHYAKQILAPRLESVIGIGTPETT